MNLANTALVTVIRHTWPWIVQPTGRLTGGGLAGEENALKVEGAPGGDDTPEGREALE